jgi:hypothetical protein
MCDDNGCGSKGIDGSFVAVKQIGGPCTRVIASEAQRPVPSTLTPRGTLFLTPETAHGDSTSCSSVYLLRYEGNNYAGWDLDLIHIPQ